MTALRPERESGTSYGHRAYGEPGTFEDWSGETGAYGGGSPADQGHAAPYEQPAEEEARADRAAAYGEPYETHREEPYGGGYRPPGDDETVALRIPAGALQAASSVSGASAAPSGSPASETTPGGRAARRKAAKRRRGRRGGPPSAGTPAAGTAGGDGPQAPLSRVEARRQARARKPGATVVASRAIGELFITTGVLMLLFVSYQLWWTNVRAHAQAGKEASSLQQDWADGKRNPGAFAPGQGFALLHIPRLDVVVPIAEGVSNKKVLDKGMVGHYGESPLKTAMPDAKTGNFGLAGHRNTHGEPFRYINRLQPGDAIVVETQDTYYVYKMASTLPVTSPGNVSVLDPVPKGSGFKAPGRYITLTTCTPEFTSKYRLIVWGKMVEERPRSKGKPDALVS
ncbi:MULTISPECIES: class E sortase [unclassified Streptomyces]|uniref:class E sortase n=1 Tax=unclassified Streptomyces TaxID=2593676 RepID=UPI001F03C9E3|nr:MULTISPECIES: class E sortase [unclassified Streptomyces]MCH0566819.1 class E sortase [Streptomyces sp. MUM 2J]MCH0570249.1 class E sortase [Streptomyces sp. MUM 136J]